MNMNYTSRENLNNKILVDLEGLMELLSCGKVTANRIGSEAGAVMYFGRRKLFNVQKIKDFLNNAN